MTQVMMLPGFSKFRVAPSRKPLMTAIEGILEEVEKMRATEVTDEELERAIDGFINSSVFDYDTKGGILSRALRYEYL